MSHKTIHPRTHDDSSGKRSSGDPIRAYLHNFALEKKSRLPATTSPYVDVNDESDDDLHRYRERREEPNQVPQRPPVELLVQALESFADKPLAKMGPRTKDNAEAYTRALRDPRNLVKCPMPNCRGGGATTETALLDHLRERHPEILRYEAWLRDQVQTPYLNWLDQRDDAEDDFNRCEQEIQRYQPLLKELQSRKQKIENKHGLTDAYTYGRNSPEYELAQTKAEDELAPIRKRIAEIQREISGYQLRQNQAERQYNFAQRKIEDMEDDPHIKPLLVPINLAGGKKTWLFDEERRELEPIVLAIARGIASEKFASGDTGIPSKGTLYRDENKYTTSEIQNWTPDAYGNNDYG
jgi:hypothetical protein